MVLSRSAVANVCLGRLLQAQGCHMVHMVQESTALLLVLSPWALGIVLQITLANNAKPSCLLEVLKEVGDGSRADNLV